jgi:hypothetical protein
MLTSRNNFSTELKNVNSCVTIELKRPIAPHRFVTTKTRDLSSKFGSGLTPAPAEKINFRVAKSCKILHFQVIDFEAEATSSRDFTGSRL